PGARRRIAARQSARRSAGGRRDSSAASLPSRRRRAIDRRATTAGSGAVPFLVGENDSRSVPLQGTWTVSLDRSLFFAACATCNRGRTAFRRLPNVGGSRSRAADVRGCEGARRRCVSGSLRQDPQAPDIKKESRAFARLSRGVVIRRR